MGSVRSIIMSLLGACRIKTAMVGVAAGALCLWYPLVSLADKITLKTGSTLEGQILREDDNQVVVFTNGMELPIQRSRIASIEKGAAPTKEETRGDELARQEEFSQAVDSYKAALKAEPMEEGLQRIQGKIDKIEAELLKRDDLRFGATFKQIAIHTQKNQFAEAEKLLNGILEQSPSELTEERVKEQLARIYYTRALDRINVIDYTNAHTYLEKAISLYPNYVDAHKKRAELLEQKSSTYDQAILAYKRVWEIGRDQMSSDDVCLVAYKLGNLNRQQRQFESALEFFKVVHELCPETYFDLIDSMAFSYVALANQTGGKADEQARQHLEQALALKPFDNDIRLQLARVNLRLNKFEDAKDLYEKCIRDGVNQENVNYELGFCHKNLNNAKAAEICMAREVALFPNNLEATIALGELHLDGGKHQEALDVFRRARQINEASYRATLGIGKALRVLKRYDDAERELLKALEVSPNNYEANFELGLLYKELQKFDKSKEYFSAVIDRLQDDRTNPENVRVTAEAFIWRGDSNRQLQLFQTAINDFQLSLEYRPGNPAAFFQMGEAYRSLEAYDKAEETYRRAISISPDNADYYLALAFLYHQNLENKDEACRYYNLYIEKGGKVATISRFLTELGCVVNAPNP